jgi:hypothetical protein
MVCLGVAGHRLPSAPPADTPPLTNATCPAASRLPRARLITAAELRWP